MQNLSATVDIEVTNTEGKDGIILKPFQTVRLEGTIYFRKITGGRGSLIVMPMSSEIEDSGGDEESPTEEKPHCPHHHRPGKDDKIGWHYDEKGQLVWGKENRYDPYWRPEDFHHGTGYPIDPEYYPYPPYPFPPYPFPPRPPKDDSGSDTGDSGSSSDTGTFEPITDGEIDDLLGD